MVAIVDFGSQTTHLIGRIIREFSIPVCILQPEDALAFLTKQKPSGIILSGGPMSVYEENAPTIDPRIFDLGIPILGICYGMQLTSKLLGGTVISGKKEYGPATLTLIDKKNKLTKSLKSSSTVWMSHGDAVTSLPEGFIVLGKTEHVPFAFVFHKEKNIFGVQFHPEVEHTTYGSELLQQFLLSCSFTLQKQEHNIPQMLQTIKETVEDSYVIGAVSGGVDSTVAGVLTAQAIGDHFIPIFVDNGLMREDAATTVKEVFANTGVSPIIIHAQDEMLKRLQGVADSEQKRKIIGAFYVELFEKEMQKLVKKKYPVRFLLQGTIYSDVIESKGTKHSDKIKSHHNVGGLPEHMKLTLLEPLRELYKDEVRSLGEKLGLPHAFVWKQVFPGPGFAVRIRGEVTKDRLQKEKQADAIVLEELKNAGVLSHVYMSFPIMTGAYSTAVKGDGRAFDEVIALRIIESKNVMTTTWARLSYDVLQRISSRIVNEVPGVSRVVYDITTKPPATMEWE